LPEEKPQPEDAGRVREVSAADFTGRGAIIRGEDYRGRSFERADVRFCSFLETNMAYMEVCGGGFVGNGWEDCSLFAWKLAGVVMEMERFQRCSMGGTGFAGLRMEGVRFRDCTFAGSVWTGTAVSKGRFENCNFRGMRFAKGSIEKTTFQNCVFDRTDLSAVRMRRVRFCGCVFRNMERMPEEGCGFKDCVVVR